MADWNPNIWAVLVAALVNLVIGMVWYSRFLFTEPWLRETGISKEEIAINPPRRAFALWAVGSLVAALALSWLHGLIGDVSLTSGVVVGVVAGVGLVAASAAGKYAFGRQSLVLYLINEGNNALGIVAMSVIIAVWP